MPASFLNSFSTQCRTRPPRLVNTARTFWVSTTIPRSSVAPTTSGSGAGARMGAAVVSLPGGTRPASGGAVAAGGADWLPGGGCGGTKKAWNANRTRKESEMARRTRRSI